MFELEKIAHPDTLEGVPAEATFENTYWNIGTETRYVRFDRTEQVTDEKGRKRLRIYLQYKKISADTTIDPQKLELLQFYDLGMGNGRLLTFQDGIELFWTGHENYYTPVSPGEEITVMYECLLESDSPVSVEYWVQDYPNGKDGGSQIRLICGEVVEMED